MNIVESGCSDILYISNLDKESQCEGAFTDVVFKNGHRYQIIDHTIAVKEENTWNKVHRIFENNRLQILMTLSLAIMVGATSLMFSPMMVESPLPIMVGILSILVGMGLPFYALISSKNRTPLSDVNPEIVANFRKITNEHNFLRFVRNTCLNKSELLLKVFTKKEAEQLFEKVASIYTFSELVKNTGFDLASAFIPTEKLIQAFNDEYIEDISIEEFEKLKKLLKLYTDMRRVAPSNGLQGFIEKGFLSDGISKKVKGVFDWFKGYFEDNKRIKVIVIPMPVHH